VVPAKPFNEELINLEVTPAIQKHLDGEIFIFSCKIVKYN
jgi:hypothetical protein